MKIKRLVGLALECALVAVFPPSAILIGAKEAVNLAAWAKRRKGKWTEEDDNKALALKMLAADPGAAMKLLGKAAFHGKPPRSYTVVSDALAMGFDIRDGLDHPEHPNPPTSNHSG